MHARAFTGDRSPRVDTKWWPQSRRSAAHGEIVARRDRERRTASIVIDRSILAAEDVCQGGTPVYGRRGSIGTPWTPRKDSYRSIAILVVKPPIDQRPIRSPGIGEQTDHPRTTCSSCPVNPPEPLATVEPDFRRVSPGTGGVIGSV